MAGPGARGGGTGLALTNPAGPPSKGDWRHAIAAGGATEPESVPAVERLEFAHERRRTGTDKSILVAMKPFVFNGFMTLGGHGREATITPFTFPHDAQGRTMSADALGERETSWSPIFVG